MCIRYLSTYLLSFQSKTLAFSRIGSCVSSDMVWAKTPVCFPFPLFPCFSPSPCFQDRPSLSFLFVFVRVCLGIALHFMPLPDVIIEHTCPSSAHQSVENITPVLQPLTARSFQLRVQSQPLLTQLPHFFPTHS